MDLVVDVAAHSIEEGGVIGVVDEKDEVVVVISLPFERNGDFGGDWEACSLESVLSFFTKWFTFAIFDSGTFCFDAVFEVSILSCLAMKSAAGGCPVPVWVRNRSLNIVSSFPSGTEYKGVCF